MFDEDNKSYSEIMHGQPVTDKTINLPSDYVIQKNIILTEMNLFHQLLIQKHQHYILTSSMQANSECTN